VDIELILSIVVFVLLLTTAILLYRGRAEAVSKKDQNVSRRLGLTTGTRTLAKASVLTEDDDSVGPANDNYLIPQSLYALVDQAGLDLSASAVVGIAGALFVAGSLVSLAFLNLGGSLVVGLGIALSPLIYLRFKRRARLRQFGEQLPYLLDLLRSALEAGHTLLRALQLAAENMAEPMGSELGRTIEQVQVGISLPQALEGIYRRIPEEELGFLAIAVRIQAQVGSSLAEILTHVATGIRTRQRLSQQLRVLTAQSRASAVIVTLVPFVVLAAFGLVRPGYAAPLFRDPTGVRLLEVAVALDLMAFLAMRRIGRVDY
jgi:tight adherence protein B